MPPGSHEPHAGEPPERVGPRRVPCVGAVILDGGRLLLVRRGRPPGAGSWSLPGGRMEPAETREQALVREVAEETGLAVTVGRLLGRVEWDGPGGVVFDIEDYACTVLGGDLRAGDDASEVGWWAGDALGALPLTESLLEVLRGWAVLPPS